MHDLQVEETEDVKDADRQFETENELLYRVDENPPLYLSFVLGFQVKFVDETPP